MLNLYTINAVLGDPFGKFLNHFFKKKIGKIILIAAVSQNNVIGKKNSLPWYLPEDLKHFKEITTGHAVLMGRKTFESIMTRLKHPLPNRKNVVVTKKADYTVPDGVKLYHSIDKAIEELTEYTDENVYVIGGATIYAQTIDHADQLLITEVHKKYDGDVFFPDIDMTKWRETSREDHDEYSFVTYERTHLSSPT